MRYCPVAEVNLPESLNEALKWFFNFGSDKSGRVFTRWYKRIEIYANSMTFSVH